MASPPWLLTVGFGRSEMYWYRVVERLGRNSLVGTTVRDPARVARSIWRRTSITPLGRPRAYIPTTVGGGCILGVVLTAAADDVHLRRPTACSPPRRGTSTPGTPPRRSTLDGWGRRRGTRVQLAVPYRSRWCSVFCTGSSRSATAAARPANCTAGCGDVVPCRHRGGVPTPDGRVSAVVRTQTWTASVREMLRSCGTKDGILRGGLFPSGMPSHEQRGGPSDEPAVPADVCRPGPARPSRLVRVTAAGLGVAVELPPHALGATTPTHDSPAHRLNGKRYHEHWLHNLMASTSLMGFRNPKPAIR